MEHKIIWREIFHEICLRALKKTHLDYNIWGIGQGNIDIPVERFKRLNNCPGLEFAIETHVCTNITQEFIYSPFTSGIRINDKHRFYEIQRERNFKYHCCCSDKEKQVDILINRYNINSTVSYSRFPALIEVKRAHYFTPDIGKGTLKNFKENSKSIAHDIKLIVKLREKIKKISNLDQDKYENFFLYELFWGYSEKNNPEEFIKKICEHLPDHIKLEEKDRLISWMPLQWSHKEGESDMKNSPTEIKWCWMCLQEILPISKEIEDDNPDHWYEK